MNDSRQSKGGKTRAKNLTDKRRSEIARQGGKAKAAAKKRLIAPTDGIIEAEFQGTLPIGETSFDCYVLSDQRRVIHKRGMARALGLKSEGGNAFIKTISGKGIGSSIPASLQEKIDNPIVFKPLSGDPGHGYEATILIEVCDAIMQARNSGSLSPNQAALALQAEIIIRSAAKIGIVALVDEATGFIADKRRQQYRELFQEFIRAELRQWEKEFPNQFFDMLYRLYGLKRKSPKTFKHPAFFGKFIRKYIYHPLANSNGAILDGLDELNPVVYAGGGRRYKMHQFLTDNIGIPAFRQHLWQVVGIGNSVNDKAAFDRAFVRAFPEVGDQLSLLP